MQNNILPTIEIGSWRATCLRDSPFWVDAGAAFHMVPKTLWGKKVTPDSLNRIPVALNCLLLQNSATNQNILLDAGIGNRYNRKDAEIYNLDRNINILNDMKQTGICADDIDIVILSHLHLDHTGWLMVEDNGKVVPFFKNAVHYIQKKEWQSAFNTNELTKGSYITEDFSSLEGENLLKLIDGDYALSPELQLIFTGNHSAGHQILKLESHGEKLLCPCEIIPDINHLRPSWVMSYDEIPGGVVEWKKKLFIEGQKSDAIFFLGHEMGFPFGKIRYNEKSCLFKPLT